MESSAKSASIFVRTEPEVKQEAEEVLNQLGIPVSTAVNMFLHQIIIHQGIPFQNTLPTKPVAFDELSTAQMNDIIRRGFEEIAAGKTYSVDEVRAQLHQEKQ